MKLYSLKLKLYTSKITTGEEVDFILLTILIILKYFKTRYAKVNIFGHYERYIFLKNSYESFNF